MTRQNKPSRARVCYLQCVRLPSISYHSIVACSKAVGLHRTAVKYCTSKYSSQGWGNRGRSRAYCCVSQGGLREQGGRSARSLRRRGMARKVYCTRRIKWSYKNGMLGLRRVFLRPRCVLALRCSARGESVWGSSLCWSHIHLGCFHGCSTAFVLRAAGAAEIPHAECRV